MSYLLIPRTAVEDDTDGDVSRETGEAGTYRATFVFGVPGMNSVMGNVHFDQLVSQGQSLVQFRDAGHGFTLNYGDADEPEHAVQVEVGLNSDRRLQYLRLDITAADFDDAHQQAYELVMPTLSRWSFIHNVGISVSSVELLEVATAARQFHFMMVGEDRPFTDMAGTESPEHLALLATFREGASSLELPYQALSFYKVIEG